MSKYRFGSIVDRNFRNTLQRLADDATAQGKAIQDLVAEGQLTPAQYAELITVINSLLKSGDINKYDLSPGLRSEINQLRDKIDKGDVTINDLSPELLEAIDRGEGAPLEVLSIPRNFSVSPIKTTFLNVSPNLHDDSKELRGSSIDTSTGEVVSNPNLRVSEFIKVDSQTNYIANFVLRYAFYDSAENFISSSAVLYGEEARSPSGAALMRVVLSGSFSENKMLNEGTKLLTYEPYRDPVLSDDINPLKKESIKKEHIANRAVGLHQTDFVSYSTNLVDKNNLKSGYSIDRGTGEEVENAAVKLSDFIIIKPNTHYTVSFNGGRAFYNENKEFISSSTVGHTFQSPNNAYYARWMILNSDVDTAQVNEGEELKAYEPYYEPHIDPSVLPSHFREERDLVNENYYVKKLESSMVYTAPLQADVSVGSPDNIRHLQHTDVYALYDDLMSNYPDYISKTLLGTESTGKEVYRYDFTPPISENTDSSSVKIPKILLVTGTHGHEKASVWITYQMFKLMCESWDESEALENLRWNVHFIVIPVQNPYGYSNISDITGNVEGLRTNANGVDIARNFPTDWRSGDSGSVTYGGIEPLSELESKYTMDVIEDEKDDLIYICDFHNFATRNLTIWNASSTKFHVNLGEHLINHVMRKWKKEHDFMNDDITSVGYANMGAPAGSLAKHAPTLGIYGDTFEVSELQPYLPDDARNSPMTIKFGLEAFVNWLNLVLENHLDD